MSKRTWYRNPKHTKAVMEARAGLIPASDDIADEERARASSVIRAMNAYSRLRTNEPKHLLIADLLTDLRLHCRTVGLNYHELDEIARQRDMEETPQLC